MADQRMGCGHDLHVLVKTSDLTAHRVGICIDLLAPPTPNPVDVYGRPCGVNGDPVTVVIDPTESVGAHGSDKPPSSDENGSGR